MIDRQACATPIFCTTVQPNSFIMDQHYCKGSLRTSASLSEAVLAQDILCDLFATVIHT